MLPRLHFNIERWKYNKDYKVYVSTMGNFKDENKQPIKPLTTNKNRYLHIKTNNRIIAAHRLVLITFKPNPDYKNLTVDHLDHNTRNNSLSNLEWVSEKENLERATTDQIVFRKSEIKKTIMSRPQNIQIKKEFGVEQIQKGNCICFGEYKVKTCTAAAELILIKNELPHSELDIKRTANRIGLAMKNNKNYFGYKFERKYVDETNKI